MGKDYRHNKRIFDNEYDDYVISTKKQKIVERIEKRKKKFDINSEIVDEFQFETDIESSSEEG